MPITLSGFFLTDVAVLVFILLLPLPTLPYLLYLFGSNPIAEAGLIFFTATTIQHIVLYCIGYYSKIIPLHRLKNLSYFQQKEQKNSKIRNFYLKIKEYSTTKLKNSSVKEVMLLRWVGVHTTLICLAMGRIKGQLHLVLVPNTIYVSIDIFYYWVLFGAGRVALTYLFPNLDVEKILGDPNLMAAVTFIFIIIFYIAYGIKKWKFSSPKGTID
jgi:hypothetical protein